MGYRVPEEHGSLEIGHLLVDVISLLTKPLQNSDCGQLTSSSSFLVMGLRQTRASAEELLAAKWSILFQVVFTISTKMPESECCQ